MESGLLEDVYDVLEGTLDELVRTRPHATTPMTSLVLAGRVRETRAAIAMLSALMRDGLPWRPAHDGHDAPHWREVVLDTLSEQRASTTYVALLTRELDELVALADRHTGPRRPMPSGMCERLGRRVGAHRRECIRELREAEDNVLAWWDVCDSSRSLVRVPYGFDVTLPELAARLCGALAVAAREAAVSSTSARETRALLDLAATDPSGVQLRAAADRHAAWAARQSGRSSGPGGSGADGDLERAAFYALDMAASPNLLTLETAVHTARQLLGPTRVRRALETSALRERLTQASRPEAR